jgi:hypothetical protein
MAKNAVGKDPYWGWVIVEEKRARERQQHVSRVLQPRRRLIRRRRKES